MALFTPLCDIVFPRTCALCGKTSVSYLCAHCAKKLPRAARPIVALNDSPFSILVAPLAYQNDVRKIIHIFKYAGRPEATVWFAAFLNDIFNEYAIIPSRSFDIVTAVPMHAAKQRLRGFNQAELLARAIAETIRIPYVPLLEKTTDRTSQTDKDRGGRYRSAAESYAVTDIAACEKKRIVLIDDVFTSGATAQACSTALRLAGSAEITVVTIAKGND